MKRSSKAKPSEASTRTQDDSIRQPKRRARGLKREQEILAAAEQVFAELGYEDANTNVIAERANCSPGSLYQFFENKEQIAEAIATKYARQLQEKQVEIIGPASEQTLEDAVDQVIDGHLRFMRDAPAYGVLLGTRAVFSGVRAQSEVLLRSSTQLIAEVLKRHAGTLREAEAQLHAEVCVRVFDGMLPLVQHPNPRTRKRAAHELKELIKRYLMPIIDGR